MTLNLTFWPHLVHNFAEPQTGNPTQNVKRTSSSVLQWQHNPKWIFTISDVDTTLTFELPRNLISSSLSPRASHSKFDKFTKPFLKYCVQWRHLEFSFGGVAQGSGDRKSRSGIHVGVHPHTNLPYSRVRTSSKQRIYKRNVIYCLLKVCERSRPKWRCFGWGLSSRQNVAEPHRSVREFLDFDRFCSQTLQKMSAYTNYFSFWGTIKEIERKTQSYTHTETNYEN